MFVFLLQGEDGLFYLCQILGANSQRGRAGRGRPFVVVLVRDDGTQLLLLPAVHAPAPPRRLPTPTGGGDPAERHQHRDRRHHHRGRHVRADDDDLLLLPELHPHPPPVQL